MPNTISPHLKLETPETESTDDDIVYVWTEMYITLVTCGEDRNTARIKADEAVEDFIGRFNHG